MMHAPMQDSSMACMATHAIQHHTIDVLLPVPCARPLHSCSLFLFHVVVTNKQIIVFTTIVPTTVQGNRTLG